MVLTVSDVARITEHALRGKPTFFEMMQLVNVVGQELTNGHEWCWMDSATLDLDTVADQNFIVIPDTVRRVIALQVKDSRTHYRVWSSPEKVLNLRQSHTGIPNGFHVAMSHHVTAGGGAPVRVLELWPTPAGSTVGFFVLWHQAQWVDVDGANDEISIPKWLEPLFLECCREWALGWMYPESGSPAQRITELKKTSVYRGAQSTDGALIGQLGRIENGAASDREGYFQLSFGDGNITP